VTTNIILMMGASVFLVRTIAFALSDRISLPVQVKVALEKVPPAILAVIIASGVLFRGADGAETLDFNNAYVYSTVATILIAIKLERFFFSLLMGCILFFLFKYFSAT